MKKNITHDIPYPVRIFCWLLILAGSFFFYVYTFNPGIVFPDANLDLYSAKLGFSSAGVRILSSVIALAVSLLCNKPQWLFITLISRVFIELGDLLIGLILDGPTPNTYALLLLAALELWAISRLYYIITSSYGNSDQNR